MVFLPWRRFLVVAVVVDNNRVRMNQFLKSYVSGECVQDALV